MNIHFDPPPDIDTAAAILGAIACYIEADRPAAADAVLPRSAWSTAGALEAQDLPPMRAATPTWAAAERAKRANRWSSGIVGL